MSKSVKLPDGIWKILMSIKLRDDRKNLGEVISDLLIKAKEVKEDVDTQSN
jgi:hypothetical protein